MKQGYVDFTDTDGDRVIAHYTETQVKIIGWFDSVVLDPYITLFSTDKESENYIKENIDSEDDDGNIIAGVDLIRIIINSWDDHREEFTVITIDEAIDIYLEN